MGLNSSLSLQSRYRVLNIFHLCPGFGQDRVNFHQNPGRGTAAWADPTPTWPNRAGYSIPCVLMLGSGRGELGGGNSLTPRELTALVRSGRATLSGLCGLGHVFSLSVPLLFLFPLFAVLLNCPYPDPPVFCLFLSILLGTPAGGGAAVWCFCCRLQPNQNNLFSSNGSLLVGDRCNLQCNSQQEH